MPYRKIIDILEFEKFEKIGRPAIAIIRDYGRRPGFLYNSKFYYQTPDRRCFVVYSGGVKGLVAENKKGENK